MNISAILLAMVVVGGTGLLIAILLGIASEKFKVPVDEKEVAIRAELPGNNCGGCGYAGCDGLAKAIANGEAPVNGCPVGGAAAAEDQCDHGCRSRRIREESRICKMCRNLRKSI